MAKEPKTNKTKHVLDLITSPRSEANPFLPSEIQEDEVIKTAEPEDTTVEDKLRSYTAKKRGKVISSRKKYKTPQNPSLHIPKEDTAKTDETNEVHIMPVTVPHPAVNEKRDEIITIDVNRIIIAEMLDEALARFNTCRCDICKAAITEKVLEIVPVKIITAPESEKASVVAVHGEFARKEISSAIIKVVMSNKRKPFH